MKTKDAMTRLVSAFVLFMAGIFTFSVQAQVTVGSDTPPAATLDVVDSNGSTPAGIIAPRLTLTELAADDSKYLPAQTGAIVYVTNATGTTTTKTAKVTAIGYYYFDGTLWQAMVPADWHLTGNAGTNPNDNFLGTTDDQPLVFRVDKTQAGYIGKTLAAIGSGALASRGGSNSFAFGTNALAANEAIGNDAFGNYTLDVNETGVYNNAFGNHALGSNISGGNNNSFGTNSLNQNTTGEYNSAFGTNALEDNITGSENSAFGNNALAQSTGYYNVAVGAGAGSGLTGGNYNIMIGYSVQPSAPSVYRELNIGNVLYGTNMYNDGNIGIGTKAPKSKLEVNGAITNTVAFNAGTSATLDFSKSNIVFTSATSALTLQNIKSGGVYRIFVNASTTSRANISAAGFTPRWSNSTGSSSGYRAYTITVLGTNILISVDLYQ